MPAISTSLISAFKQILQSLQVPFLFPAGVFVFVTLVLYPGKIEVDASTMLFLAISASVLLSYLLYACNTPLTRIAEGYSLPDSWLFRLSLWFESNRRNKLVDEIAKCDNRIGRLTVLRSSLFVHSMLTPELDRKLLVMRTKWQDRKRPLEERLELRYPPVSREPLPTALGNTISAFEAYSWERYRMDAVHIWPRLLPILDNKKFIQFVQTEKAVFDFLLNIGVVILGICCQLLLLFSLQADWRFLVAAGLLVGLAYVLYRGAIVAAQQWGGMVRVAFDLYREDLRKALFLPEIPDGSLVKEREMWQAVSDFLVFGNDAGLEGFVYSKPANDPARKEEDAECEESG